MVHSAFKDYLKPLCGKQKYEQVYRTNSHTNNTVVCAESEEKNVTLNNDISILDYLICFLGKLLCI